MTRFARAKGSKASNLKAPDDSTPWEVMKEQMLKSKKDTEDSKNREEAEKQRIENYNNFLKEQKTQKRKSTWCEFPEAQSNNKTNSNATQNEKVKNKRKKLNNHQSTVSCSQEDNMQNGPKCDNEERKKESQKKKIKKNFNISGQNVDCSSKLNECSNEDVTKIEFHKNNANSNDNDVSCIEKKNINTQQKSLKNKKNKKNKKQKQLSVAKDVTVSEVSLNNVEKESSQLEHVPSIKDGKTEKKKKKKNKKLKQLPEQIVNADTGKPTNNTDDNVNTSKAEFVNKKKEKNKKGRKKPINDRSFQLIINAKEVQLIRFDGFPIMKKDAERLEELKKNMIKKGIPKSEVQRTMKLERRRAEKALARLKRDVCYNCRKGGHNLSDCPELKSSIPGVSSAEGVCFKCGSTEHRQFECKVQRDKEFRFATCFICKESGHIARQCPDNPKGLYPNGGCCKLCGDVTHLRKDCPTIKEKKEGSSIKLQTLNDDNIEDIEQNVKPVTEETSKKPKKIKF